MILKITYTKNARLRPINVFRKITLENTYDIIKNSRFRSVLSNGLQLRAFIFHVKQNLFCFSGKHHILTHSYEANA
jgi:hypothetical protein